MIELNTRTQKIARHLTAPKSTSMAAAVIFACTFLPISGGAIKPYEVRKIRESVAALFNGGTPQIVLAHYPHRSGVIVATPRETEPQRASMVTASAIPDGVKIALADAAEHDGGLTPVTQTFGPEPEMCLDCSTEGEALWLDDAELQDLPEVEAPDEADDLTIG